MVFFFYGADSFRIRQKVNEIIVKYKAKHQSGLNFGRFDFSEEESFEKFKNFIEAYSMFAEKKLAIVENLFEALAGLKEEFLAFIEQGDILKTEERFIVVAQSMELNDDRKKKEKYILKDDLTRKLFKKLISRPISQEEFNFLSGAKLENWVKMEVQKNGGKMAPLAIKKLAVFVGADLWQMRNEVSKLVSYKVDKLITEQDIDTLVKSKIESDIFKMVDALANRQKTAAFKFLHQNLALGESEIALLSKMVYQFRNLLLVKSQIEQGVPFYTLEKKLGLHPFVLRKTFEQSKNFSLGALKKIYERLSEIDLAIKSGQIEPRVALDLVVGEITG
jgi:DNA polymerase-3 subunit delta